LLHLVKEDDDGVGNHVANQRHLPTRYYIGISYTFSRLYFWRNASERCHMIWDGAIRPSIAIVYVYFSFGLGKQDPMIRGDPLLHLVKEDDDGVGNHVANQRLLPTRIIIASLWLSLL
jgi:hypothetical protein